jgi:hypothetical protein
MKKSTLFFPFFAAFFIFTGSVMTTTFAQAQTFGVGTNVIAIEGGLGTVLPGTPGHHWPVTDVQYDRGLWNAGRGVISLGAYAGYGDYSNNSTPQPGAKTMYPRSITFTTVGLRGAYHFAGWQVRNLDAYVGVKLAYESTASGGYADAQLNQDVRSIQFRPFFGTRYFFLPFLGAIAEIGFNAYQFFDLGLAVKL